MKAKLFLTGLALMAVTVSASAQNPVTSQGRGNCKGPGNGTNKGISFVDKNNNGTCDNSESRTANATDNKGRGTGICDGSGKGQGQGKGQKINFVDADKNGICDTYEARTKK